MAAEEGMVKSEDRKVGGTDDRLNVELRKAGTEEY
jgi:hypothetical protein